MEVIHKCPAGTAGNGFVVTTLGKTYYEYRPGTSDRTIVFIHGFALPSGVWEKIFFVLADRGYHVMRFDRFGTGRSATSRAVHSMELFIAQLKELVDTLRLPLPLSLVGLSLGGAVAARFAVAHTTLVHSLCLIAPAVSEALPGQARLAVLPGVGRLIVRIIAKRYLKRNLTTALSSDDPDRVFQRECLAQADRPTYRRALLSTLRHTMLRRESFAYASLSTLSLPVRLIWGTEDTVVPFRYAAAVRRALGTCEFYPLEGAGHCPVWERPDKVNNLLLTFMCQT